MLTERDLFKKARLIAQPGTKLPDPMAPTGLHAFQLDKQRDGLLYVPPGYATNQPAPLALMLHGAGGDAEHGLSLLRPLADAAHIILVAPVSRSHSWDIINFDRFGPDIVFINQALTETFNRYSIDAKRIAIGGFSDGASYALSVGLTNGDLFTHIIAFSPGFYYSPELRGKPRVFISHGTADDVLPVNPCSRKIVPGLQRQGYSVLYHEFDGTHTIPPDISQQAVKWFIAG
jgi:phospholipase/carboxylesterase